MITLQEWARMERETEWGASCHYGSCHWTTRTAGYWTMQEALVQYDRHIARWHPRRNQA